MKIERYDLPRSTIEEFAAQHNLIMEVRERGARTTSTRFYASFRDAEVSEPGVLVSASGNGATPEDAIADYASKISERLLVVGAYTTERREIPVPVLIASHAR